MISSIDDTITVWLASHRWSPLNEPSVWLGKIEKLGAIWIVLAIVVGLVTKRGVLGIVGVALLTAATTFAADAASLGIKDLVHRPRPFEAHPQIHPLYVVHSSSFPAGHAATAFAGAAVVSWLAPRATPGFVALAALIGFSRVYVGDHYPSDVLGGATVGALVALGVLVLVHALSRRPRRRPSLRVSGVCSARASCRMGRASTDR